ncbi:hypothetical protein D9757_001933 [Collybiopsis confluens]|uniref:Ribosome biogenesis protein NSA1 n=1 Tax=Collybiopsis confluens TaxID=2823264 RepID=A0A8H5HXJ8_9AGAR|nr:hypothetical protein D9757_001933 [Collybiopsis confluens]
MITLSMALPSFAVTEYISFCLSSISFLVESIACCTVFQASCVVLCLAACRDVMRASSGVERKVSFSSLPSSLRGASMVNRRSGISAPFSAMFAVGDQLGSIKLLQPDQHFRILHTHSHTVQRLSANSGLQQLAAAYSDGSAQLFDISAEKSLQQWSEPRLKSGQRYIGLQCTPKHVFSCTSNGALRMTPVSVQNSDPLPTHSNALLPTRLCDWRLSVELDTFAYGGDEVSLSVWNTERAFQNQLQEPSSSKRKHQSLFPGEVWRAKNAPNDHLGLRQPIRITTLTYLSPSSGSRHLLTGTQLGSVQRYDTRTAKSVSDWKISKVGGIEALEQGFNPYEIFVSDSESNLFSLDSRTGHICYKYKGLAGAVTSLAPSPASIVSVARDRYCRIHSTFAPPDQPGQQQEHKGEVIHKIFTIGSPTVVVWVGDPPSSTTVPSPKDGTDNEDNEIWENMKDVRDEDKPTKRRKV